MINLSNRGYPMLRTFTDESSDYFMTIEEAKRYDQRSFGSMLKRQYISYRAGRGFHLTKAGREAWRLFENTEIWRKNPESPLTSFFDPTAYGLKIVKRRSAAA